MRQNNCLISVVIPTYKRPNMLDDAIESVLNQTYNNIEIIVVDDNIPNSTYRKNTEQIMKSYNQIRNIFYIKHSKNKGGSSARNTGIKNSNGKFIGFLDDDDQWFKNKLELQIELFNNNENLGVVYCRGVSFIKKEDKLYNKEDGDLVKGDIFKDMLSKNYFGTSAALVKKECFDKVGLFDVNLPSRQDHDMFLRISKYYEFDYVDDYLIKSGLHKNRMSFNLESKKNGWDKFLNKWQKELDNNPKTKDELLQNYNFELGKIYYYQKEYNKSKKHMVSLLKINRRHLKAYIILFLSLLKIDIKNIF